MVCAPVQYESGVDCRISQRTHLAIAGLGGGLLSSTDRGQYIPFGDDAAAYRDARVVVGNQFLDRSDTMMRFSVIQQILQSENRGGDRLRLFGSIRFPVGSRSRTLQE